MPSSPKFPPPGYYSVDLLKGVMLLTFELPLHLNARQEICDYLFRSEARHSKPKRVQTSTAGSERIYILANPQLKQWSFKTAKLSWDFADLLTSPNHHDQPESERNEQTLIHAHSNAHGL